MEALVNIGYLVAATLFIFGLKRMSHPRTAVMGNLLGAVGMALAVLLAMLGLRQYWYIGAGLAVGTALGAWIALRVQMTAMPQMVALLNGLGGAASMLVAGADLMQADAAHLTWDVLLAAGLTGLIGGVTLTGSLIAYAKLQELPQFKRPFPIPAPQAINAALLVLILLLHVPLTMNYAWVFVPIALLSLALGVLLVNPIGGADMPVVIALLNSYSGLAAAATGFVIDNNVLIVSGSLVGASGVILANLMCKAMNRSLTNVLFGGGSAAGTGPKADEIYTTVRGASADDIAMVLDGARRVVVVPGYGMAVAQAQHAVRDLGNLLESRGATVEYAIHPVAGRMPGHMNVLLAEADVSYDKLKEMDEINPTMDTVDVAIVIGANDVVNPLARTDPQSPIAGMPIIDVDKARSIVVIKRSLSPGFAGIPNPLFALPQTLMLFADGRDAVLEVVKAVKDL